MSAPEQDPVANALAGAGKRPDASPEVTAGVRATVEQAWLQEVGHRRRNRRRQRSWMTAAVLLAGAGLILLVNWELQRRSELPVGIFLASRGAVDIRSPDRSQTALGGKTLLAGTRVQTGSAGMALLALGEISIRIGPASVVNLIRTDRLELAQGRIYLDFGAHESRSRELQLITPLGSIEHLGTQFQASVDAHRLAVSVREGQVRLMTAQGERLLGAREAADVDDQGRMQVQPVQPYGEEWAWTTLLVPDFPIEGQTLAQFLDWFARETGQRIDYATQEVRNAARRTRLSGSIVGLSPQDALQAVIAATQFNYEVLANGGLRVTMHATAHAKLRSDGTEWLETRFSTQD